MNGSHQLLRVYTQRMLHTIIGLLQRSGTNRVSGKDRRKKRIRSPMTCPTYQGDNLPSERFVLCRGGAGSERRQQPRHAPHLVLHCTLNDHCSERVQRRGRGFGCSGGTRPRRRRNSFEISVGTFTRGWGLGSSAGSSDGTRPSRRTDGDG